MISMGKPQFLINDIINANKDISVLREKLFHHGIKTKEYPKDDLIIIYHNYNTSSKSDLQRECRSLLLKMSTLEIVSYSCESPLLNEFPSYNKKILPNKTSDNATPLGDVSPSDNATLNIASNYNDDLEIVSKCYEGTCLSLFYHNNRWYVSTRKHLNTIDDELVSVKFNEMYNLFLDVLLASGYSSFEEFTDKLNKENVYNMILLHHNNVHTINYSNLFNDTNYKKLVLISVKNQDMFEILFDGITFLSENIFVPELSSIDYFYTKDHNTNYNLLPSCEGIIINRWDNKMKKFRLIKLQYNNYIYNSLLDNPSKKLLYLYQIGKLKGNLNLAQTDQVFKLCTSEIISLFKLLWDDKTGEKINNDIYSKLPKEYKYIMFKVRGVFYLNKKNIRINDVYLLLKRIPVFHIISMLKTRDFLDEILINSDMLKYITTQQLSNYKTFISTL